MPIFVDHVGLNSVVNDELNTETNTKLGFSKRTVTEIVLDKAIRSPAEGTGNRQGLFANSISGYASSNTPITFSCWVKFENSGPLSGGRYVVQFYGSSGSTRAFEIFLSGSFIDNLKVCFP